MIPYQEKFISSEKIPDALKTAFHHFNNSIGTSYSEANVKIGYFTPEDFTTVFRKFCEKDFPSWLKEDYSRLSYFSDMQASAFIEGDKAGILINTFVPFTYTEWVHDLTHELAHIYAVQNEYLGRSFYDEHCSNKDIPVNEDVIYIGYAVWREFIADYITAFTTPHKPRPDLDVFMADIREFDSLTMSIDKDSFGAISLILVALFTCQEYMDAQDKEGFYKLLADRKPVDLDEYGKLIDHVFDKVNDEKTEPHIIDVDFIETFGSLVRQLIFGRCF